MVALKAALGARQGDKHTVVLALALETALVAGSRGARLRRYTAWRAVRERGGLRICLG